MDIYLQWVNFLVSNHGSSMREYSEPGDIKSTPGYQLVKCVVGYITQVYREYRCKMKGNVKF